MELLYQTRQQLNPIVQAHAYFDGRIEMLVHCSELSCHRVFEYPDFLGELYVPLSDNARCFPAFEQTKF